MDTQENPNDMPNLQCAAKSFEQPSHSPDLARIFNTAMVSSRNNEAADYFAELFTLVETSAFQSILVAVKDLASREGIPENEASEKIIKTFRKMDQIWKSYMYQEGKQFILKS